MSQQFVPTLVPVSQKCPNDRQWDGVCICCKSHVPIPPFRGGWTGTYNTPSMTAKRDMFRNKGIDCIGTVFGELTDLIGVPLRDSVFGTMEFFGNLADAHGGMIGYERDYTASDFSGGGRRRLRFSNTPIRFFD